MGTRCRGKWASVEKVEPGSGASIVVRQNWLKVSGSSRCPSDDLTLQSETGHINLAAKKRIHIATEQGASITIENNGNITFECPGTITYYRQSTTLQGQVEVPYEMEERPETEFEHL
jgi:hypothetical protein